MATSSSSKDNTYFDHFTCNICFQVLREPVQCVRNEHYFCKPCITQHLTLSPTCPVCQECLTATTLRPTSRVVTNPLKQFQSLRCRCANQRCTASVRCEVLLSHHEECSFAPVRCSNEGCEETVNRQDLVSHEESCKFGTVTCEECNERMNQEEYGKHPCVFRKDLDRNRFGLVEVQKILQEIQKEHRRQGDRIQQLASEIVNQSSTIRKSQASVDGQIVVAGGGSRSYEVFNWSTKKWTLYKNTLLFNHDDAFSFAYDNKIMICAGTNMNKVECLDVTNPICSISRFPSLLPSGDCDKGALCGDKILTFGRSVSATNLKAPHKTEVHISYNHQNYDKLSAYGAVCVNENGVVIGGGCYNYRKGVSCSRLTNDVTLYNATTKQLDELASLPYEVSNMAVLAYNDNVIILGGTKEYGKMTNDVLMYNVTSQQCSKLPSMLEERSKCAGVIMGDTIIAFGGNSGKGGTMQAVKTAGPSILITLRKV